MNIKMKILIAFLIVVLIAGIVTTTIFVMRGPSRDDKNTTYDSVKKNKKENFTFLNKSGAAEKNQTVLIGDSITEIYNVQDLFGKFTRESGQFVYNRGISGDTSDRMFERLDTNALNIAPKNLVVLIGINDIGRGISIDFTVDNIKKIINLAKEKCPTTNLIIQAVYPVNREMNPKMVGRRKNEDIKNLNDKIKAASIDKGVKFLDLTSVLSDESGMLNAEYCYDGLHLNAKGFKVVTDNLVPLLEK